MCKPHALSQLDKMWCKDASLVQWYSRLCRSLPPCKWKAHTATKTASISSSRFLLDRLKRVEPTNRKLLDRRLIPLNSPHQGTQQFQSKFEAWSRPDCKLWRCGSRESHLWRASTLCLCCRWGHPCSPSWRTLCRLWFSLTKLRVGGRGRLFSNEGSGVQLLR